MHHRPDRYHNVSRRLVMVGTIWAPNAPALSYFLRKAV